MSNLQKLKETQERLNKEIEELGKQIKEMEEPTSKGRRIPSVGDNYWVITERGDILCNVYESCRFDKTYGSIGNYYKTKEEAEKAVKRLKATQKVIDAIAEVNAGWEPDFTNGDEAKYYIHYDHHKGDLRYCSAYSDQLIPKEYYFNDRLQFGKIVEIAGKDNIKLHLRVEDA